MSHCEALQASAAIEHDEEGANNARGSQSAVASIFEPGEASDGREPLPVAAQGHSSPGKPAASAEFNEAAAAAAAPAAAWLSSVTDMQRRHQALMRRERAAAAAAAEAAAARQRALERERDEVRVAHAEALERCAGLRQELAGAAVALAQAGAHCSQAEAAREAAEQVRPPSCAACCT
jgi:hypothetical protein